MHQQVRSRRRSFVCIDRRRRPSRSYRGQSAPRRSRYQGQLIGPTWLYSIKSTPYNTQGVLFNCYNYMTDRTETYYQWIESHLSDDPAALRLKFAHRHDDGIDYADAITQIECRRKFGKSSPILSLPIRTSASLPFLPESSPPPTHSRHGTARSCPKALRRPTSQPALASTCSI